MRRLKRIAAAALVLCFSGVRPAAAADGFRPKDTGNQVDQKPLSEGHFMLTTCRCRITKIRRQSPFGIGLDNGPAIDNN